MRFIYVNPEDEIVFDWLLLSPYKPIPIYWIDTDSILEHIIPLMEPEYIPEFVYEIS